MRGGGAGRDGENICALAALASTKLPARPPPLPPLHTRPPTRPRPQETKSKKDKAIIQGVSAVVKSGHVLAILGPSGAGKTTLINVLTLNAFGGVSKGYVALNGNTITPKSFVRECYVVSQQDFHW